MSAQLTAALLLLLLAAILGIRSALRSRCLGKCAGCPRAMNCKKSLPALPDDHKQPSIL